MADDNREPAHSGWSDQVQEQALEPELPICDAHHHLWPGPGHTGWPYPLENFRADTGSGHNVVNTVFVECNAEYRSEGPVHLRPVGETEYIAGIAAQSASGDGATIAAIVAYADLSRGDAVEEVLAAHQEAGRGLFRGVRYLTVYDDYPPLDVVASCAMDDPKYRAAVRKIGAMGFSCDALVYHPQLPELLEVARACPDTPIVINHLGAPLGIGPYRDRREEILGFWRKAIADLASCPNTCLKIGGLGMPMMGIRWDRQPTPPDSKELAAPWVEPIHYAIEQFGPGRCMFESNFPVDKRYLGYAVLWNAFKRIAHGYSAAEKRDLFHDSAARAYGIEAKIWR